MSKLDEAIMMNREKPLTAEELKGFGKQAKAKPTIQPWVTSMRYKDKNTRKQKIVPLVGVKINF